MTDNHSYDEPTLGSTSGWGSQLNSNFRDLDTDVEIRDTDANKGNYTPKDGALYRATDTGAIYQGDGTSWVLADMEVGSFSAENATITRWRQPATYTVFKLSGTYYGMHNDGSLDYSNSDFAAVVNNIILDQYDDTSTSSPNGLAIRIVAGEYPVSTTIHLKDGVRLIGEGMRSTVLKLASGADTNVVDYVAKSGQKRQYFAGLYDLKIDGNKANNTTGHCLYTDENTTDIDDADDLHLERVFFHRAPEDNIHYKTAWGLNVDHCLSENAGARGLYIAPDNQIHLSNMFIAYNGEHGLQSNAADVQLSNIEFYRNGYHGMYQNGAGRVVGSTLISFGNGQNAAGQAGYYIQSDDVSLSSIIGADIQSTATQSEGVVVDAADVSINGGSFFGNKNNDVKVTSGATLPKINAHYNTLTDSGTRTVLNGWGENAGDPSSTGQWNGNGYEGASVVDTTNSTKYVYRGGGWV